MVELCFVFMEIKSDVMDVPAFNLVGQIRRSWDVMDCFGEKGM